MARSLWSGAISFGLVNIPVMLYPAEQSERSHFHLLDKRNKSRIHYERVNDKSGKPVPWEDVVKAFEYEKDNYVVINEKELEQSTDPDFKTIDLKEFVDKADIEFPYLEKPYYLAPSKQGEKGYALLMETLEKTKKVGIATFVIKTKQHIALLIPYRNILLLNILRFADELRNPADLYNYNEKGNQKNKQRKLSSEEISMAERLVKSMSGKWNPKKYRNKSHELLKKWIEKKIKKGKTVTAANEPEEEKTASNRAKKGAKVVDFMSLLKKSVNESKKKETKNKEDNKETRSKSHVRKKEGSSKQHARKH